MRGKTPFITYQKVIGKNKRNIFASSSTDRQIDKSKVTQSRFLS